jgi:tryptophan-rich sensory protein
MSFLGSADEDPKRRARRPLLFFLLVTLAVGAAASLFTEPSIPTWYAGLARPSFAPPNWVFAPVWTTLYVLMAVAAWRVWKRLRPASPARGALAEGRGSRPSEPSVVAGPRASADRWGLINIEMGAYGAQLVFNFGWSAIFFAAHQIGLALADIGLLLLLVLATTALFWRRDRVAGLLFLPYLLWTGFAAALNQGFWALNP